MSSTIPELVTTEFGEATVGVVQSRNAWKIFLCPLCDENIEISEKHLVVVPMIDDELRRHLHTDCLLTWKAHGLTIKLHPFGTPKGYMNIGGKMRKKGNSSAQDPGGI